MEPSREDTYTDAEGVTIHFSVWEHPSPRATVQIVHGLGDHHRRYDHVAGALVAAGYEVWADDHRGHGRTGHGHDGLGKVGTGGHRAAVAAVHRFTTMIAQARPGIPHVLLGHSWGSMLSQILVNQHPEDYDAVVLTGSVYRLPGWMNSGDLTKRHRATDGHGNAWLSRDPAVWEDNEADPFTFEADAFKVFGLAGVLSLLGRPAAGLPSDLPVLLAVGGDDSFGGPRSVERLAKAYRERSGLTDVRTLVYPDARHEILNETNKVSVIADIVDWMDAKVPVS